MGRDGLSARSGLLQHEWSTGSLKLAAYLQNLTCDIVAPAQTAGLLPVDRSVATYNCIDTTAPSQCCCCQQLLLPLVSLARQARRPTSSDREKSPIRRSGRPPILRPLLAGMISSAAVLYACEWDSTRRGFPGPTAFTTASSSAKRSRGYHNSDVYSSSKNNNNRKTAESLRGARTVLDAADKPTLGSSSWGGGGDRANPLGVKATANKEEVLGGGGRQDGWGSGNPGAVANAGVPGAGSSPGTDGRPPLRFSEDAVRAVVDAVESYAASARRTLEADKLAVLQGRPLQVRTARNSWRPLRKIPSSVACLHSCLHSCLQPACSL